MRAPALTFFFLLLLTGSGASAAEPLVIGEINPLTGPLAFQGTVVVQIQNGRHVDLYPKARAAAPVQLPAR